MDAFNFFQAGWFCILSNPIFFPILLDSSMRRIHRCSWAGSDPLMRRYHDSEWGVPVHNDRKLFEMLTLEGAQAGLSWQTILNKRQAYRNAFFRFDILRVASFTRQKQRALLRNPGIVRNRAKIAATIQNARAILAVQKEFGSFNAYVWRFVRKPSTSRRRHAREIPPQTIESVMMSRDLRKRGFAFVGPTICYAFMQAVGMVNDHTIDCFRYRVLAGRS